MLIDGRNVDPCLTMGPLTVALGLEKSTIAVLDERRGPIDDILYKKNNLKIIEYSNQTQEELLTQVQEALN